MQAQLSLRLCGVTKNLNLSSLDLESAYNPGLASDSSRQSNLAPKQCRHGKHTRREQGQTQCGLLRKAMTNPDNILKNRGVILLTKVYIVKPMVFPMVMHGCESWTIIKKAEC